MTSKNPVNPVGAWTSATSVSLIAAIASYPSFVESKVSTRRTCGSLPSYSSSVEAAANRNPFRRRTPVGLKAALPTRARAGPRLS
jgi:hypothetical protein